MKSGEYRSVISSALPMMMIRMLRSGVSECHQLCFTDNDDQNVVIRRILECHQLCFTDNDDQNVVIRRASECYQL